MEFRKTVMITLYARQQKRHRCINSLLENLAIFIFLTIYHLFIYFFLLYNIRKLWYIYTMEYYSAIKKNTFESVLMRWMKLEPITQSEVSQKEKHQYSILTHIYGI